MSKKPSPKPRKKVTAKVKAVKAWAIWQPRQQRWIPEYPQSGTPRLFEFKSNALGYACGSEKVIPVTITPTPRSRK